LYARSNLPLAIYCTGDLPPPSAVPTDARAGHVRDLCNKKQNPRAAGVLLIQM